MGRRKRDWDELGSWDGHVYTTMCMDMYPLRCVKEIASENLLSSTGSSAWCSVVTWRGGMGVGVEFKRDETHVYTWLIHCVVQQRLTQYSKATIPQLKRKKKEF